MYPRGQNADFRNYPYIPPSDPMTSLNPMTSINSMSHSKTNFQYQAVPQPLLPQPEQRTTPSYFTNTSLIPTYTSECFQRFYQPTTTLRDLADPGWTYDDLAPPVNYQNNINAVLEGYSPTNPVRRSTVSETRLATAVSMREQLLTDILRDMGDINEEISSMEGQLSKSHQRPYGFTSMADREPINPDADLESTQYLSEPVVFPKTMGNGSAWN
ncbi:hypothetical protein I4U23_014399 [Adineta vaga]|nr:hypothetical protein I4U23_014399 [Adineta vaga]